MKNAPDEWPWIAETMTELVARCGSDTLLSAPLLLPSERFFPDRLPPGTRGVRRVVRRMMRHAGLGSVYVELQTDAPEPSEGARSPVDFVRLNEDGAVFAVRWNCAHEELAGHLCFEVARAFRAVHHLDERVSPYRDNHARRSEEELTRLAAVTAVYLGFGVLALNASHAYEARGEQQGYMAITEWNHSFAGGLPLKPLAWALALQTALRGPADESVAAAVRELRPNQAAAHQEGVMAIERQRDVWLERLALPPEGTWPVVRSVDMKVIPEDEADRQVAAEEARAIEHAAALQAERGVYRVVVKRGGIGTSMLALCVFGLLPLTLTLRSPEPVFVWGGTALALAGCYLLYWLLGYRGRCSTLSCAHALRPTDQSCPGCGLHIVGEVRAGRDELDIEQNDDLDAQWDTEADR